MKKILSLGLITLLTLSTSGCSKLYTQGHSFDEQTINHLKNSKANKNKVLEILGDPEVVSDASPNTWYYLKRTMKSSSISKPKVVCQEVLKIVFDGYQKLKDIKLLKNEEANVLNLSKNQTPIIGSDENSFKNYWNNLGKFNSK